MTQNRKLKQAARNFSKKHGISYTKALVQVRIETDNCSPKSDTGTAFQHEFTQFIQPFLEHLFASSENHAVAGKTASGKSTFATEITLHALKAGKSVTYFDPGNENIILRDTENDKLYYANSIDEIKVLKALASDLFIYDELRNNDVIVQTMLRSDVPTIVLLYTNTLQQVDARLEYLEIEVSEIATATMIERLQTNEDNPLVVGLAESTMEEIAYMIENPCSD